MGADTNDSAVFCHPFLSHDHSSEINPPGGAVNFHRIRSPWISISSIIVWSSSLDHSQLCRSQPLSAWLCLWYTDTSKNRSFTHCLAIWCFVNSQRFSNARILKVVHTNHKSCVFCQVQAPILAHYYFCCYCCRSRRHCCCYRGCCHRCCHHRCPRRYCFVVIGVVIVVVFVVVIAVVVLIAVVFHRRRRFHRHHYCRRCYRCCSYRRCCRCFWPCCCCCWTIFERLHYRNVVLVNIISVLIVFVVVIVIVVVFIKHFTNISKSSHIHFPISPLNSFIFLVIS